MTALRGEAALESGLVRIQGADEVAGAGFLVAADVVCTCAHVVADALGLPRDTVTAPSEAVQVEFPLVRDAEGGIPARRARVVSWQPPAEDDSGDVALLRLDAPVSHARPVPLVDGTSVWGHSFRAYGFPGGGDHGVWATGTLRSVQGAGWVQMDTGPGGPRVTNGYSGAAVWDDVQGGVVGLAVAAGRGDLAGTAFLVPSAALVDEEVLRPTCPFRGLDVFEEEDAVFFHGREDDTERLAASITERPLTVLVGPSGCGKSSLIRAGLLPRLRADGMGVSVLRPVSGTPPETLLAHALVPVLEPKSGEVDRMSEAGKLARLLGGESGGPAGTVGPTGADSGRTPHAVAALRASLEEKAGRSGHLIVVDQLEEYAGAEPSAARTLLRLLLALTEGPGAGRGLRVVATARQESLDVLLTSRTSGSLSDAVLFLAPLDAENLHRVITGPVDAVPGLWLEPGLAERIVEDAADEPGRMPLVEFTLTRLWERRERSMLTHAAYDELGGVAGTLVGYADDAYRTHVSAADEGPARRLFVQLARPDDRGGYIRRAVPAARLDPAAAELARRLARGKLVVIGRTAEGTEIVDLTHEALTRLWPRLRAWLDDSRNFRQWQEQLRADMARWEAKDRETGALQRGKTLAEGEEWLRWRPEDVTADERAYIEAGHRYEQRTVRRLLAGGALLTALLLVAGTLGAIAWDTGRELRTQLRTLASRALAEESGSRQAQEPGTAVQLALAAWHADRTPQAREALLAQYARVQYARGLHTGLWRGRVRDLAATPDGRTLVVRSKPDNGHPYEVSVVTGVPDGTPQHYTLGGVPETEQRGAVSPDGRHYATAMPDSTVRLWRLDGQGSEPTRLGGRLTSGREGVSGRVTAGLDFSADGSRLLRWFDLHTPDDPAAKPRAFLDVWDLDGLEPLPVADTVVSTVGDQSVRFGEDADTVEVTTTNSENAGTPDGTVLRDLDTGRVLRKITDDGASGGWTGSDATGAYGYDTADLAEFGYADLTLGRRGTDDTYVTRLPLDDEPGYDGPKFTVVEAAEGGLTVLSPVGNTLVVAHAPAAPRPDPALSSGLSVLSPDGDRSARLTEHGLRVADLVHGGTTTGELPTGYDEYTSSLVWTRDGKYLVLAQEGGSRLHVYDADTPSDRVDVPLDEGRTADDEQGLAGVLEPLPDGDVVALTRGGSLLRADPERGAWTGEPLTVDPSPRGLVFPQVVSQILSRPNHPDQLVVVTPDDVDNGTIQIWDLRTRTRTTTLEGDEVGWAFAGDDTDNLAFSPDGRYLAVAHNDGMLHRWDLRKKARVGTPVPIHGGQSVLAVTNSGVMITAEGGAFGLWDPDGIRIGTIPGRPYSTAVLRGAQLIVEYEDRRTAFALDPGTWLSHLCEHADRAFTAEEREHLPPGTPPEPPCTGA